MDVVNVKCACLRPKYNDLKEWCEDTNNVYIGRKGVVFVLDPQTNTRSRYPKTDSMWANPYKITDKTPRQYVLTKYREHMIARLESEPGLKHELANLRTKTLGCWCVPEPCHGHILQELMEMYA